MGDSIMHSCGKIRKLEGHHSMLAANQETELLSMALVNMEHYFQVSKKRKSWNSLYLNQ